MKKIVIIALLRLCAMVNAQVEIPSDSIKVTPLKEVIVSGDIRKDPAQVIIKSDYQNKVVQPKNSGQLFEDINGFSLIKRGNYAVEPSFRASQYEQLNIQYDGGTKAYHACPNRMDPITTLVNPEEVTRIEIIKGPFSVRYGTNFGGVINMVTQTGTLANKKIQGSISSGYESNGNSSVNMINLMSRINKFYIAGNLSYRDYGNYEDGNQNEIPSSFRNTGYGLKFGYDFNEKNSLQASFRQNFGRDVLHAGLPMDTDKDDSTIGSLDYKLTSNNNYFKGLHAKIYYSFVDHIMSNYRRPSFTNSEAIALVDATTFGGKLESEWNLGTNWKLFGGTDFVALSREGNRNRLVKRNMMGVLLPTPLAFEDKIWQDSYTNTLGAFLEARYFITEKASLTLGSRLDFVSSNAEDLDPTFAALYPNLEKRNETNYSGNISFKQYLPNHKTVEISYGRGSRSASIEERFIAFFNIGRDPYEYVGNPNLKAEVNNQFEISFNGKKFFEGKTINQINYGIATYYSIYENYILGVVDETLIRKYNPTTPPIHPKVFRNIDNAMKTGFETYLDVKLYNHFNFLTELAYVYTENKDFNENLPLTPPLQTRFKLGYETEKFWASVQYNLTARQPKISQSFDEIATPGYEVMDIKAGFSPLKNLSIGGAVLNVFDQYYNNHLTFAFNNQPDFGRTPITEPGRNFTLFVNYKF
ncbi:TonB-dependent receptor domain-containing protein [Flavobacterium tibetense]|uniref:TonB-dependent receptor n=1 Tax=Flavobacterium tibetense TaxID=2233533 RepID=A0A365P3U4_9FLAO|nr:TonB-dependent receptor [Flavobacterium tibetense]RBA29206.1 TonB-dependent receptor [Flavobacterium tibetense]